MAKFMKGDVVAVPFPFSDLTQAKRRPALVVTALAGDDVILCQITSQSLRDQYSIEISDDDFQQSGLKQKSNVRPNRLFTADGHIILYKIGRLKLTATDRIIAFLVKIIQEGEG